MMKNSLGCAVRISGAGIMKYTMPFFRSQRKTGLPFSVAEAQINSLLRTVATFQFAGTEPAARECAGTSTGMVFSV